LFAQLTYVFCEKIGFALLYFDELLILDLYGLL